MRKILRNIARANMAKAGCRKVNKRRTLTNPAAGLMERQPSFFAANWRRYV